MSRTKRLASRARIFIAGAVVAGALLVPMSVAVPQAGAISHSPFCNAVFSWAEHQKPTPTTFSIASYHSWVKEILPYYEKMEATAPSAKTKQILSFIVTVLKAYSSYTSMSKLSAYENAHRATYTADEKALAKTIAACA
jgi:hypothetical protein